MRSHVCCHADGNAVCSIDQQIRYLGRQNGRFLQTVIEVIGKINRILIYISQHLRSDFRHSRLGVTHCSRRVIIDRTKVSLSVNHGISQRPPLSHSHHGHINRAVAVRVVLTEYLSHYSGRFFVFGVVSHSHVAHGVQNSAVNRF